MKNDNIKYISILLISVIVSSLVSVAASGHLFDSNEVVYDNSGNDIQSTNVQGAVDELYAAATDYSNLSGRVQTLEGYFQNNPKSIFDGHNLEIAKNETGNNSAFVDFWSNGINRGGVGVAGDTGYMTLVAKNENSQFGKGTLDLRANNIYLNNGNNTSKVYINGKTIDRNYLIVSWNDSTQRTIDPFGALNLGGSLSYPSYSGYTFKQILAGYGNGNLGIIVYPNGWVFNASDAKRTFNSINWILLYEKTF